MYVGHVQLSDCMNIVNDFPMMSSAHAIINNNYCLTLAAEKLDLRS